MREKSITCQQCHSPAQQLLPLKDLGYSDERIQQIIRSELIPMIEQYGRFRFPTIFERRNK
jgi:hypothetical protein